MNGQAGKGDTPRPTDMTRFSTNWDKINWQHTNHKMKTFKFAIYRNHTILVKDEVEIPATDIVTAQSILSELTASDDVINSEYFTERELIFETLSKTNEPIEISNLN
jgi:hypothetical protein